MAEWEVRYAGNPPPAPKVFDLTEDGKAALYDADPDAVVRFIEDFGDLDEDRLLFDGYPARDLDDLRVMMMR